MEPYCKFYSMVQGTCARRGSNSIYSMAPYWKFYSMQGTCARRGNNSIYSMVPYCKFYSMSSYWTYLNFFFVRSNFNCSLWNPSALVRIPRSPAQIFNFLKKSVSFLTVYPRVFMLSRQVGPLPGPSGEEKILKFDTSLEAYLYVFLGISQCSSNFLAGGFDREGYFSSVFQLPDWEPGPGEERSRLY